MEEEPVVEVERPSGVTSTHTTPREDIRIRPRGAGRTMLAVLSIVVAAAIWFFATRGERDSGDPGSPAAAAAGAERPDEGAGADEAPTPEEVEREARTAAEQAARDVEAELDE